MATYKVLQDVEAEDKLVGPLTLRQFIYAAISAFLLYLSFFALTKNVGFLLIFFVPPALFTGFLAIPWHGDQPTEVWAIAKLRFMLKPRKRIWDQSGAKELVTITVPKKIERSLTNGLSQIEVRSRLHALADTIDSRGWAVKNVNVNLSTGPSSYSTASDRLVDAMSLPQDVSGVDVRATDDMLDPSASVVAQHFDSMIQSAATAQRQQLLEQMQSPTAQSTAQSPQNTPQNDYWFMHQPTPVAGQSTFNNAAVVAPGMTTASEPPAVAQAVAPTAEEEALIVQLKATNESHSTANNHLKHIKTSAELAEEQRLFMAQKAAEAAEKQRAERQKAQVTSEKEAAIMNLARNDDLDVATIARQAKKEVQSNDGEVVISLH
ncbi:PrgI family protein [Candidatus Saccharibacteria bacterium]|nr:MAG: PrgI family protein [Candidatus Saccharibacteria bacterium]